MKKKFPIFVVVLLLIFINNELFAQEKIIAYTGYATGKSNNVLVSEGKGALIGLSVETPTKKKNLFLDVGLELTYLMNSEELPVGLTCEGCDPVISPGGFVAVSYTHLTLPTTPYV